jgi:hypothetical protein
LFDCCQPTFFVNKQMYCQCLDGLLDHLIFHSMTRFKQFHYLRMFWNWLQEILSVWEFQWIMEAHIWRLQGSQNLKLNIVLVIDCISVWTKQWNRFLKFRNS